MRHQKRRILGGIGGAALLCATFGGATASAQVIPPPPVIVPSAGGCMFVAELGSCIGVVMPVSPPTAGFVPLGPLGESREGRVDVNRDVDRSHTPGRVIVR